MITQAIRSVLKKVALEHYIDLLLFKKRIRKGGYTSTVSNIENLYSYIIKDNDLVFDIGANIGNYSQAFNNLGAKVISLEPQSTCFDFLKIRFKNNSRVTIVKCAADNSIGERSIFLSNSHTVSSMSEEWIKNVKQSNRFPEANWKKKETIHTTTLDFLIEKYGTPSYCKIDVEGFEYNVLSGLSKKISLISIEFTYEHLENTKKCLQHLEKIGKISILIEGSKNDFNDPNNWCDSKEIIRKIELLNDKKAGGDLFIKIE